MAFRTFGPVLRHFDRLFGDGAVAGLGEGELLRRFLADRDEAAFAALVDRHGPTVLGVCRRVLDDPHDVDDAFQATFLILVRRAGAIRDGDLLGNWLYGVARRVALRARARAAGRRARETAGAEETAVDRSPPDDADRRELERVLDEEVTRLPEKLREPILLCYFQGQTHDEAARRLKWPVGTVRSRMSKARDLLRQRLTRRGLALPATLAGVAGTGTAVRAEVPAALAAATVRAALQCASGQAIAAGTISAGASALVNEVSTAMILNNAKWAAGAILTLGLAVGGVTVTARQVGGSAPAATTPAAEGSQDLQKRLEEVVRLAEASQAREKSLTEEVRRLRAELGAIRGPRTATAPAGGSAVASTPTQFIPPQLGPSGAALAPGGTGIGSLPHGTTVPSSTPLGMTQSISGGGATIQLGLPGASLPRGGAALDIIPATKAKSRTLSTTSTILMPSAAEDKILAYSTEKGVWLPYEAREGTKVKPFFNEVITALGVEGPKITEVAAFDPKTARWTSHQLVEPAEGKLFPWVTQRGMACYVVGRRIYAFTTSGDVWSDLELPEGSQPTPLVHEKAIIVEADGKLHAFSGATGKWESVNVDAK